MSLRVTLGSVLGVLVAAGLGCGEDPTALVVDLRTDYLPGLEFSAAEVRLDDGPALGVAAVPGLDFATGRRLAEYDDVSRGAHSVTVTLLTAGGSPIASRRTELEVRETSGLTVIITRDCADVACPSAGGDRAATECLGGRCIPPSCHTGDLDACGAADCTMPSDCESDVTCLQGMCVAGACLRVARDNRCAPEEQCDVVEGCVEPECVPSPEICDGVDDEDCDGMVDEGCVCTTGWSQPCGSDVGTCVSGVETCDGDGAWGPCEGNTGPQREVCEGAVDESCDGAVDEGCACTGGAVRACGTDVGDCTAGTQTCDASGTWGTCAGATAPATELCDGSRDEDCDGMVDEGCDCVEGEFRPCGSDVGACELGAETCASGAFGPCTGSRDPITERCNGIDDDCDGVVDSTAACTDCDLIYRGTEPYLFCDVPRGVDDARSHCQSLGYDLVKIEDATENAWLAAEVGASSSGEWWIGLRHMGATDYRWVVDGSALGYAGWESSEPRGEDCVQLRYSGFWRTRSCGVNRPYICALPP